MAELSLWLDYYDDIYSDFDSRHYQKRRVSDDFIHELKNTLRYHKEKVSDLYLLLPQERRDKNTETIIAGSLEEYFSLQFHFHSEICSKKFRRGIILGLTGIFLMILNSFASLKFSNSLLLVILRVVADPAGWFLLWTSFDFLFYNLKEMKKEKGFFRNLAELNIHFKAS